MVFDGLFKAHSDGATGVGVYWVPKPELSPNLYATPQISVSTLLLEKLRSQAYIRLFWVAVHARAHHNPGHRNVGEIEVHITAPHCGSPVTLGMVLGLLIFISSSADSKNTHLNSFPGGLNWNRCDHLHKVSGKEGAQ